MANACSLPSTYMPTISYDFASTNNPPGDVNPGAITSDPVKICFNPPISIFYFGNNSGYLWSNFRWG